MVKMQNFVTWIRIASLFMQKADDICKDIAGDVEKRYGTSNFEIDRPLPIGKSKKVIGLLRGQIMTKLLN